jgi:quercetin dioxygenase-like cupin family protein
MSKPGDVYENPVTGERAITRVAGDELTVADLYVAPGGAVAGEHTHPGIEEIFTVVSGSVGFRVDGCEDVAGPGQRLVVPPGVAHYWWNAGNEEAHVVVELRGERRLLEGFVTMLSNIFGLARDGKTDAKGQAEPAAGRAPGQAVRRGDPLRRAPARRAEGSCSGYSRPSRGSSATAPSTPDTGPRVSSRWSPGPDMPGRKLPRGRRGSGHRVPLLIQKGTRQTMKTALKKTQRAGRMAAVGAAMVSAGLLLAALAGTAREAEATFPGRAGRSR